MLRDPPGQQEARPLTHVHRMIADALIEARHHSKLNCDLQVDLFARVTLENFLNELPLQSVEERVHVIDRGGLGRADRARR